MPDVETDRPIETEAVDELGFTEIARKLAPSLADATMSDGMVVGIEGPWGSGKTSLLNLLREELARLKRPDLHVITLAPWLVGDTTSLVVELTTAIADVLDSLEQPKGFWGTGKNKIKKYTAVLRTYGTRTGRMAAPLMKTASLVYPPLGVIGEGLGSGADFLDGLGRKPTDAEIKRLISTRLLDMGVSFLVLIDDLDRLEPGQATEVVRMVRSVADFPKVAYVMCYDRSVLAHALRLGLQVEDGDLFLQKVVQLTFGMPLPEPFDLRLSMRTKALAIYVEAHGRAPETDEYNDLWRAIDQEGAGLRTPRDVKLALNSIRFAFRAMPREVYFPDLCRICLIKALRPPLHRWLENYLSLYSVVCLGDAHLDADEILTIGTEVGELQPSKSIGSTRSVWHLGQFIPGLDNDDEPSKRVFNEVSDDKMIDFVQKKRLGSPFHFRRYFALTSPKNVLTDAQFDELLKLAEHDTAALSEKLRSYAASSRPYGQNWFEHIMDRLNKAVLKGCNDKSLWGIGAGISDAMDDILAFDQSIDVFRQSFATQGMNTVRDVIREARARESTLATGLVKHISTTCASVSWLVGTFLRKELWDQGAVGDRRKPEHEWCLTPDELVLARSILQKRVDVISGEGNVSKLPNLSSFLYGWRDLSGGEAPRGWTESFIEDDDNLLAFLLAMRGLSVSNTVTYPLRKSAIEMFCVWEEVVGRVEAIKELDHPAERVNKAKSILESIEP